MIACTVSGVLLKYMYVDVLCHRGFNLQLFLSGVLGFMLLSFLEFMSVLHGPHSYYTHTHFSACIFMIKYDGCQFEFLY